MNYMAIPKVQVTFGSTVTDGLINANIVLTENAYWTATLTFRNLPAIYPSIVTCGTTVLVEVQDGAVGGAWTTLFVGTVLFPDYSFGSSQAIIVLTCVNLGYALNMMNVAEEYGQESRHPLLTNIHDILLGNVSDVWGIIPKWVNTYKQSGYASGYSITHGTTPSTIDTITGTIPYISFPWKPADASLNDLCDLLTAINGTGVQWIVDHSHDLHVKTIGADQSTWHKYYGGADNTVGQATLSPGVDFFDGDFQPVDKQANVVLYYGTWRRPSNGDVWTESSASDWGVNGTSSKTDSTDYHIVGNKSLKASTTDGGLGTYYPSTNAEWNFSVFSTFATPTLNFYIYNPARAVGFAFFVRLIDTNNHSMLAELTSSISSDATWFHFELPIGTYYRQNHTANSWGWANVGGTFDWAHVDHVQFEDNTITGTANWYIDGLNFGNASIIRIARQEFPSEVLPGRGTLGTTANPVKFKVITDNIGKDDTLASGTPGTTDIGLLAQMAKAELLRLSKATINGKFSTPMIPDILPGQYVHIDKDYRITKLTQQIPSFGTAFEVTDDLTNSHTRLRYEDINKVYAAIRPEYQDKQAASLKSGNMDIHILPLEEAYNI